MMKPWIYSLVGGLLILGSSAISGVYVSKLESCEANLNKKIANLSSELSKAEQAYEIANLHNGLGYIQRSVIRYSIFQDKDIQTKWDAVHAASLYTEILNLRVANGLELDNKEVASITNLREKVGEGDKEAYEKLKETSAHLTRQSGIYRGSIIVQIADHESQKSNISNNISISREIAIFTQLAGLFILLIKELPLSRRNKKLNNDA